MFSGHSYNAPNKEKNQLPTVSYTEGTKAQLEYRSAKQEFPVPKHPILEEWDHLVTASEGFEG